MSDQATARSLLTASAVRDRAHEMLAIAEAGGLAEWRLDLSRLDAAADLTAETVRLNYPDLKVPFHARWRHFVVDGRDLWAERDKPSDPAALGRAAFDLVIPSVLLDAGAGAAWRYRDAATGAVLGRSEGLGVASLRFFESGAMSSDPADPLRADALGKVDAAMIGRAFQVTADNPLVGLEGRAALLHRLGEAVGRPGALFDIMARHAENGRLPAPVILEVLLQALGPIWPGRLSLGGVPLGDCWTHPAVDGFVPLHKLSQWMSYSLIEPLEASGVTVTDVDGLTGLAEYRNGGLFVDLGVLVLKDPEDAGRAHPVDGPLVVGWRSLTVALLDQLAPMVRDRLGVTAEDFPLARVLEGGSWAAGRRIAKAKRPDLSPPIAVISDGTVF
ncbi:MAG: URC4/urg3 family protein [Alphaproteobacteria bacterium]|nr:URC4/urg3 family protein [Alphaproteobacteria bacterium]MBU1515233.1 URC4/urg3 family protein [Alphaproteobacteria bacterium]MBU2092363.1 URC4/urg3 family protein [Alphaproteobacteria bacterium]MBU2152957.1 URC4/urg3 family protein [Alphaproteobacteria bacterium]MBU2305788.1 URC4/urg3 family protein [Alphaproteobacteria bacterium]